VKFKRFISHIAAGLALLSIGGTSSAKAPTSAHPALWAVSDADTTVYLFGTIHLLPADYPWRSDAFDSAVAGSQELVLETIVDDKNPAKLMAALSGLAFTKGLPPLAERVPVAKRPALAAAIKRSGFPPAALDMMETWAAAFMLLGAQFKDLDLKAGEGVETVLRSEFSGRGKPIGELETNVEQFGFFDRLSEKAQRSLLEGAIDAGPEVKDTFNTMLSAWSRGDIRAIAKVFNRDLADSPELANAVIAQRNANWTKWVEARMAKPGTVLVAVGAGHLAGDGSVVEMLKQQGMTVRRVQ
jgi:uncharacterized protein YbaP (TraB family)